MKVLLVNFRLNSHTLGFHPQTQKLIDLRFNYTCCLLAY